MKYRTDAERRLARQEYQRAYNRRYYAYRVAGGLDIDLAMKLYAKLIQRGHTRDDARAGVYMAARDGLLGYRYGQER